MMEVITFAAAQGIAKIAFDKFVEGGAVDRVQRKKVSKVAKV